MQSEESQKPEATAFARATTAADFLRSHLADDLQRPYAAIVCGSGLGGLQDALIDESKVTVPYDQIPGMPRLSGKNKSRASLRAEPLLTRQRLTPAMYS